MGLLFPSTAVGRCCSVVVVDRSLAVVRLYRME